MVHNDGFLRENGICYPRALRVSPGHQKVVHHLKKPVEDGFRDLLNEVAPYETVFLSTENFTRLSVKNIRQLISLFDGYDIQVLFFYRGYHDLWPSHWQETVKHGAFNGWPDYLLTALGFSDKATLGHLNPDLVLGRWSHVLGQEKLQIFPYAAIGKGPLDALKPVCSVLGIEAAALRTEERGRNASYPPRRIEAIRALNRSAALAGLPRGAEIRRQYMKKAVKLESSPAFTALQEHFDKHARTSVLRQQDSYLSHVRNSFLDKYGKRFMTSLPENEAKREKTVLFLDSTYPVPDGIVADLASLLWEGQRG